MNANKATAKSPDALRAQITAQQDIVGQSLTKASGLLFVMGQVSDPEIVDDEATADAVWAIRDFVQDARAASLKAAELTRELWILTEPDPAKRAAMMGGLAALQESQGGEQ
jgi:hypothetical protein